MAFKQAQKITLSDLDSAAREYEALLKQTEKIYGSWDAQKDRSFSLIGEVESLAASISHAPFTISRKLKKLTVTREDYNSRESLVRKKRKEDIAAGAGAVAVLGAGAAAAVSFWEYVAGFVSKRTGGKVGKSALVWLVVLLLVLIAGIVLLIGWAINRWRVAREAAKNTKKLQKLIHDLKRKAADAETLTEELSMQCSIVAQYIEGLVQYSGHLFKEIPREEQKFLVMMVDEAVLLSELMGKESK